MRKLAESDVLISRRAHTGRSTNARGRRAGSTHLRFGPEAVFAEPLDL